MQPTILVVEDHEETRDMLRIALETEGYRVVTAASGVKLMPLIREAQPALILLDIMMPWVDGYELARAIKETDDLAQIPIFFITAKINREDVEAGYAAGAVEYLQKPLDLGLLFAKIRAHLKPAL